MKNLFGVVVRLLATSSTTNRLLYEHGYHAGNYADVVKHTALVELLSHMCKKKSPFVYVETHSGAGGYALSSKESQQLSEHEQGISMFLKNQKTGELLHPSTETLLGIMEQASSNMDLAEGETIYPGSPMIASALCRDQDSLLFCEKEAEQFELLQSRMKDSSQQKDGDNDRVVLLQENGYKALKRFENLQSSKRALVFIDPPYQMGSDSEQIASLVGFLGKHWRSARVAIWHPVSRNNRDRADRLYELVQKAVAADKKTELLATELYDDTIDHVGTGMLLVNPPFGIDEDLKALYSSLGDALTRGSGNPEIMIKRL
mmetsp:Transcript_1051/g.2064  ORF Transcript_1051/g.2064 Transcript_1051/m.2064 type:complete len:317 (+) Transcript_1051:173-1123(+)